LLAGCANQSKEQTGEQAGVVLGALLGAAIGKNSNSRAIGLFAGAVAGGLVGRSIGRHLDEVDRLKAQAAANAAVKQPAAARVDWKSDQNPTVSGTVLTTAPSNTTAGTCRFVRHIVYVNGQEMKEDSKVCQKSDGSWQLA
jgi:surface antigen